MSDTTPNDTPPDSHADCIFCKIARGEMNADIVLENDDVVVFRDINPQAPTHLLVIPRKHIPSLEDAADEDGELLGKVYLAARDAARKEGIAHEGYRTVLNTGANGGQVVFHLHVHLLGGRAMGWPPG